MIVTNPSDDHRILLVGDQSIADDVATHLTARGLTPDAPLPAGDR